MSSPLSGRRGLIASVSTLALATSSLALGLAAPATASPSGDALVLSEVYGGGGNSGATLTHDFVELFNPTDAPISVDGMSVQYRSSGNGGTGVTALAGSVPAGGHYLVQEAQGTGGTEALPTPDATGTLAMGGGSGIVALASTTDPLTLDPAAPTGGVLVDLVGYGSASVFEGGAPAPELSSTTAAARGPQGGDTDDNAADLSAGEPTPTGTSGDGGGEQPPTEPPAPGRAVTIAEIQGTGAASPLEGQRVTTTGVVTARYATGGLDGLVVQTPGTGRGADATPGASDGIFVNGGSLDETDYAVGDSLELSGTVAERFDVTEIVPAGPADVADVYPSGDVTALATALPATDAEREAHESELLAPQGGFTVTNTYATNTYAEIGLAVGDTPLVQPTEVEDAQTGDVAGVEADNAARAVTLDDGASTNFTRGDGADTPVPYLTRPNGSPRPVRVGAPVTFTAPVVLSYGFDAWRFQPTSPLTSDDALPVNIENTRTDAPEAVPGDLRLATFNVLNYFATTGEEFAAGPGSCTYYTDRAGNPITTNRCEPDGPRGAADDVNLERQQAKIVAAINTLGADVVSLEEIENSVKFGQDRDAALETLVTALNAAAGSPTWAHVPSPAPADLPATADQDVIRTAFIYRPAALETVGASRVLVDEAFSNARQPLAQAFKPAGGRDTEAFTVIVNHFKSKGSGVDDGTGQGNANPDRVAQAEALLAFADDVETSSGVARTFLTGDFNAYSQEDPIQALVAGGYTRVESDTEGEETYSFSGLSGSLDHVLANDAALADVRGADVWNISSGESLAFEYSRYNTNVTDFYAADPFRASDHDPEIVGISLPAAGPTGDVAELNLLSVNDFHGRIFEDTVKWAGTVEQLRAQGGEDDTLFVGAGDLIGASLFASNVAQDQPTIEVMNALGLDASAVGNHEFDRGWIDLRDRVIGADGQRNAMWDYLGANVYEEGTTDPVLPEFALFTVDGVDVAVVGAVTEETAELVAPSGIEDITFGDPTDAVNRVAAELSDGDQANGEADVVVASFHAGAAQGEDTFEQNVARGGEFADMVDLDPAVDVIFNGHTHQVYAYDAPVTGGDLATRPILQTGSYADNVGQVTLEVDRSTGEVLAYDARNVARTDIADDELAATYPRVAAVQQIVDDALAAAAEIGDQPVAEVTDDVTTAFSGGAYGPDGYAGGTRDDRGSESTLGDLVGNALRDSLDFGDPDLGVTNPGGLRAELLYAGDTATNPENTDGVVTYAEANSVLPFGNTVALVDLTGAQLKDVLEQQWQPDGADRAYLQLGLSDNVRVTADPDRDRGDRITSVSIDGKPLDAGATYTVSTFGFLAGGGDNFEAFSEGSTTDTGVLDAELWRDYLASASPISPDFARQQVQVTGAPTAGTEGTLVVADLDLTSLGSPANTEVTATLVDGGTETDLVAVPVVDGTAEVDVTVPGDVTPGAVVRLVAAPSGTTVDVPVEVVEQVETTLEATAQRQVYGRRGAVDVTVGPEGSAAGGEVTLRDGAEVLATADVADGSATLVVPRRALEPGRYDLRVAYAGDATHAAATTTVRLRVVRAIPRVGVTATPEVLKFKKDRTTVRTRVGARGFEPTGFVVLYVDGSPRAVAELEDGRASLRAGPFRRTGEHTLGVLYLGDEHATRAADETTVTVQKRNPRRR